jgi:hypothetical protein
LSAASWVWASKVRHRLFGAAQRFHQADLVFFIGLEGLGPQALAHGAHHQQGEDQRHAGQHARGQALLQAKCGAQQSQHDDEAREGGHHQGHHGQQAQQRHEDEDLGLDRQLCHPVALLAFQQGDIGGLGVAHAKP